MPSRVRAGALVASNTVVLLNAPREPRHPRLINGRIAVGWLFVEDRDGAGAGAAAVNGGPLGGGEIADAANWSRRCRLTLGQVAPFVALMLIVGRRLFSLAAVAGRAPARASCSRCA